MDIGRWYNPRGPLYGHLVNRGLIVAIVCAFPVLWGWLGHGIVWDVPPQVIRLGSTPGAGTEALAFARARGTVLGVELLDFVAPRQVLRGITSDSLDGGVISLEDAVLASSGGEDIVIVGVLGPTDIALATRVLISRPAGSTPTPLAVVGPFQAASMEALKLAASQPEAFHAFAIRRGSRAIGQPRAPLQDDAVRTQMAEVNDVVTRGIAALRVKGFPMSDSVLTSLVRMPRP
jgi:hypothetical protein